MMARADKFKPTGLSGGDVKAGASYRRRRRPHAEDRQRQAARRAQGRRRAPATLKKGDELVFLGEEKDGYVKVQGSSAEGWVKKTLVSKR